MSAPSESESDDSCYEQDSPGPAVANATGIKAKIVKATNFRNHVHQTVNHFNFRRKPVKSFHNVSAPMRNFQGRLPLLKSIHGKLQSCPKLVHWEENAVALVGYGGMGKSELTRKLVADYKAYYPNVVWIESETENSLKTSFLDLAKLLGLRDMPGKSGCEIAKTVFRHVGKHIPSSLFIYDNANYLKTSADGVFGILDYLPREQYDHPPLILITSQTKAWEQHKVDTLSIAELTQEEAIKFFRSHFGLSKAEFKREKNLRSGIEKLAECIQGYPLGLQLAAGNIEYSPTDDPISLLQRNVESFTSIFRQKIDGRILDQPLNTVSDYQRTFRIVWDMTMDRLCKGKYASGSLHILHILAYCSPDKTGVDDLRAVYASFAPQDMKRLYQGDTFDLAMKPLFRLMLITKFSEGFFFFTTKYSRVRIHRVVQKLARQDKKVGVGLSYFLTADANLSASPESLSALATPQMGLAEFCRYFSLAVLVQLLCRDVNPSTTGTPLMLKFGDMLQRSNAPQWDSTKGLFKLVKGFQTEKDVASLYKFAAKYANDLKFPFRGVAYCRALYCLHAEPFSCNPFILREFRVRTLVAACLSSFFGLAFYIWYRSDNAYAAWGTLACTWLLIKGARRALSRYNDEMFT